MIPVLGRWKQEDQECEGSLGYMRALSEHQDIQREEGGGREGGEREG